MILIKKMQYEKNPWTKGLAKGYQKPGFSILLNGTEMEALGPQNFSTAGLNTFKKVSSHLFPNI